MTPPTLEPMRGEDSVWLQDSKANPMIINAVLLFDRITFEDFCQVWDLKVMQKTNSAGQMQYHRFRKKVVAKRGRFYWQEDLSFDINKHLFAINDPTVQTEDDLAGYLGREASNRV